MLERGEERLRVGGWVSGREGRGERKEGGRVAGRRGRRRVAGQEAADHPSPH